MRTKLAVVVVTIAAVLSSAACSEGENTSNTGSGSVTTGANSVETNAVDVTGVGPEGWVGADSGITQVKTSGLSNPFQACQFTLVPMATTIEGDATKNGAVPIVMNQDYYSPQRNVPVRQCRSHGDDGWRLTVTTLRDNDGDDTGYNSVSEFYDSTKGNAVNAGELGVQKGFYVQTGDDRLGAVIKAPRGMVIIFQFGAPVKDKVGLDEMIRAASEAEAQMFDGLMGLAEGGKVLPQPTLK